MGRSGITKPIPGGVAFELADDEIHAIRQAVAIAADLDERTFADERLELAVERRAFLSGNPRARESARAAWPGDALGPGSGEVGGRRHDSHQF